MTAEHKEQKPGEIHTAIRESLKKLSEQSLAVNETVTQALSNGSVDVPGVIAALELTSQISTTMQSFLEHQGQVIFSADQHLQPSTTDAEDENNPDPIEPEGPQTFGELLRSRIENDLLPKDKDFFRKSEIYKIAMNASGVRKAALAEDIPPKKSKLTREQVIIILYRLFTTPAGSFKNRQESYSLQEFKKSFPQTGDLVNRFSQEINYDWQKNPKIDYETAMEIRGLIELDKVLTGKKIARTGSSGAQFRRESVDAPTPSIEQATIFPSQPSAFTN